VPDATSGAEFACPDLTTFCGLDDLGLEVTGQRLEGDRAVLACRVVEPDGWCQRCGCEGVPRDTVLRPLAHEPFGWRPTTLLVTLRRYRCAGCGHVWRQDASKAVEPRAKLSRRALRWALEAIVVQHLTIARVAEALAVAWDTANDAVEPDRKQAKILMEQLIAPVSSGVPTALTEIVTLGRTLKQRAADVLAYFDRPGTSNGPTEAINGRVEHLRGSASASATSPTTSRDACSRPEASDPDYTVDWVSRVAGRR
jgi:transposase